jgi:hypothetical protein
MSLLTGPLSMNPIYIAINWHDTPSENAETPRKSAQYLGVVRDLSINPYWVGLSEQGSDCSVALNWLASHIGSINRELDAILQDCLGCFHAGQRPEVQIFAAPILPRAGIDGFCNPDVQPVTLVVDPGRVARADWYRLVIHELAHAMAKSAGHGEPFRTALGHLCLAFDLPTPPDDSPDLLQIWPPYEANPHWAEFWHLT